MLLESSDEEEDEETEEFIQAPNPLDVLKEAEATAARTLAKSAVQAYLKKLQGQCLEAVGKPELQQKQLQALVEHAARHPEMQPPRPAPASVPASGSQSPAKSVHSPAKAPSAEATPTAQSKLESPSPPKEDGSPAANDVSHSPSPAKGGTDASPKRGALSPSAKRSSPGRSSPAAKQSPSSPAKRGNSRGGPRRGPESPKAPKPTLPRVAPSPKATAAPVSPAARAPKQASQPLGATSSTIEPSEKAGASLSYLQETALSLEMQMQAGYGTSSLTQLPSSTWRGPGSSLGEERDMFLNNLSKHKSMPLITFLPRRSADLWPTNSNPAPGTYPPKDETRTSKYQAPRQVSFGFSRRFSRWPQNAERKPGPGAHSLANFERFKYAEPTGRSFSRAPRGRPNPVRQTGPGPGAYGVKFGSAEEGPAVTMVGKFRKRGVLNYDEPGPGAYDPSTVLCQKTAAAVGFATALREDFYPKEDKDKPAPGAYHDGFVNNPIGSDTLAFSMVGKHRKRDLTRHLYADPGPGFYKHASSFGYSSTWVKPQARMEQAGAGASPH